jgi:uncharacterized protein
VHAIDPLYTISGFFVGMLIGLTGVGGGSLMTPVLVLLFGIHPALAVGTDLLYAAATKSGGTLIHALHRNIDWRIVGRLATGSVPAAAITLAALSRFDMRGMTAASAISTILGAALFATAATLIFRRQIVDFYEARIGELDPERTRLLTIAGGAVLGILVSLSSVGAGAIGVTALILLYPRLPLARIVGSDIAHAVPLTLVGGIGHAWLGTVDWLLLGLLLLGSLPGIVFGSYLAARVSERVLRPILAATLVVVGTKLAF